MLDRRCNFCGDICEEESPSREIPHSNGRKFRVTIDIEDLEVNYTKEEAKAYSYSAFYFLGGPPKSEEYSLDICWECAAHMVGVAYQTNAPKLIGESPCKDTRKLGITIDQAAKLKAIQPKGKKRK